MTNKKTNRGLDEMKVAGASVGAEEGAATRRNFLFSLLGGLAGAAGLSAIVARSKTAITGRSGKEPAAYRKVRGPIDNIFVPLSPRENVKRRGL